MLDAVGHRDFTATIPGTKLVGDITCLPAEAGRLYLAVVIDLATRMMVVGWSMASHMRASLVIGALHMARERGQLAPDGAVFYSDYAEGNSKPMSWDFVPVRGEKLGLTLA